MTVQPPPWEDPRRALRRHGLQPKRSFSQNFLVSRSAVERIAAAVMTGPPQHVVELGAGVGTLTSALLRAGAQVTAIERDREMIALLEEDLGGVAGLELVAADAASLDYAALAAPHGGSVAVAGNLPYAITGAILRQLTEQAAAISRAVLMIQSEVRDRMLAQPADKAYGALTVFVTNQFDVSPVVRVPAGAFHPPPKVDSAVVRLDRRPSPQANETPHFQKVVQAAFTSRRKTLRNALRVAGASTEAAETILEQAAVDGSRRGETLSIHEFAAVGRAWGKVDKAG